MVGTMYVIRISSSIDFLDAKDEFLLLRCVLAKKPGIDFFFNFIYLSCFLCLPTNLRSLVGVRVNDTIHADPRAFGQAP